MGTKFYNLEKGFTIFLRNKGFMIYEFSYLYPFKTLKILSRICQRAISENEL